MTGWEILFLVLSNTEMLYLLIFIAEKVERTWNSVRFLLDFIKLLREYDRVAVNDLFEEFLPAYSPFVLEILLRIHG